MVSSIADIDSNFTINCVENWMTSIPFHIVSRLVEISYSRNMILSVFSHVTPSLVNDYSCIPNSRSFVITLKDRADNNHPMSFRKFRDELKAFTMLSTLCEFHPRLLLSSAKEERSSPAFLKTDNICTCKSCNLNNLLNSAKDCISLLDNWSACRYHNLILNGCKSYQAWRSSLFSCRWDLVSLKVYSDCICFFFCSCSNVQFCVISTIKNAFHLTAVFCIRDVSFDDILQTLYFSILHFRLFDT
mmetsp:Transcript_13661/g.20566  ORF Transcript_13661/g.20566 Transcript_13661/m.20566 type:complete len:245 (+) Transcript_13661:592-1326(+)